MGGDKGIHALVVQGGPVAEVGDEFIHFLRKRPDGSHWPSGTKLYTADPAPVAKPADMRSLAQGFEVTGPDADGLLWLVLHGVGTTGKAMFNLGAASRVAGQVALLWEQDRRAALAAAPAPVAQGEPIEPDDFRAVAVLSAKLALQRIELGNPAGAADALHRILSASQRPAAPDLGAQGDMRAAFEAWIKSDSTLPVTRDEHSYADMTTALMWHAWQAAKKASAPEGALVGGGSTRDAGPSLAEADHSCAHDFVVQPSSGIKLCAHCGLSEVAAHKPAAPAPVALTPAQQHADRLLSALELGLHLVENLGGVNCHEAITARVAIAHATGQEGGAE